MIAGWFTAALAHHGTATSQITPAMPTLPTGAAHDLARWEVGTRYDLSRFDRTVDGRRRETADEALSVHTLTAHAEWTSAAGTSFGLSAPVGVVVFTGVDAAGLGDLSAHVGQRLAASDQAAWRLFGGVSAPTGARGSVTANQGIDLTPTDDGGLLVATYDTRANLSRGVFTVRAGTAAQASVGPLRIAGRADLVQPLHADARGVRWGPDLDAVALADGALGDRVRIGGTVDHRWHGRDRGAFIDADTGASLPFDVGRRRAVGVGGRIEVALSRAASCSAEFRTPLWQWSGSPALMEALSTGVGCVVRREVRPRAT
jgi:hypothetical protein